MLTLVTAVGGPDSNSYITLNEFEEISELLRMPLDDWRQTCTEEGQSFRIICGANMTDGLPWRGKKVYCGQRMAFPRTSQMTDHTDTTEAAPTVIPEEIKIVQVRMVHIITDYVQYGETNDGDVGPDVSQLSLSGLLSVSFRGTGGSELTRTIRDSSEVVGMLAKKYLSSVRGRPVTFACREYVAP